MPDIAFINGRFLPWHEATVPIEDRGFQFGDGVYEVIRTYGGRPFELEAHLNRLDRSARELSLVQPYTREQWTAWIQQGIRDAGYAEAKVYLQITRGVAARDHAFPSNIAPTVVMTIRELMPFPVKTRESGVIAKTCEDLRWGRCDIKSVNLLANVLAREEAKRAGVFEAILVKDGLVTEGLFRHSRNPMYVGKFLMVLSASIATMVVVMLSPPMTDSISIWISSIARP